MRERRQRRKVRNAADVRRLDERQGSCLRGGKAVEPRPEAGRWALSSHRRGGSAQPHELRRAGGCRARQAPPREATHPRRRRGAHPAGSFEAARRRKAAFILTSPPEVPSSPSLSPPMPSIRIVDEVAVAPPDVNGHPAVESPAMRDGGIAPASERVPEPASAAPATVAVRARNVADSPPVALPEERPSVRVLEPAPVPQDRLSSRTLVPAEPVSAPPAPEPPAAAPPPPPAPVVERPTDDAAAAAAPAPALEPSEPPAAPPVVLPPTTAAPPPPPPVVTMAPPEPPTQRASQAAQAPKTGVEYWTGRPGVPMPAPGTTSSSSSRASSTQPNMPRRVQYDPRAGAVGAPSGRRDVRAPGQQPGRPMMGRTPGGAGGRRMSGPMPPRKPPIVSTQEMSAHKKVIRIENDVTLQTMAQQMSLKATELLMKLLSMGMSNVHINTTLDADTAKILAGEFGWEVEDVGKSEEQTIAEARGEEEKRSRRDDPIGDRASPGRHCHGSRRPRQDEPPRQDPQGQRRGRRGGRHHAAHRRLQGRDEARYDRVPRYAGSRGVHPDARSRRRRYRHRRPRRRCGRRRDAADEGGDRPRQGGEGPHHRRRQQDRQAERRPGAGEARAGRAGPGQPEEWGGDTMFVNVSAVTGEGIDQPARVHRAPEPRSSSSRPIPTEPRAAPSSRRCSIAAAVRSRACSFRTERCASATSSSPAPASARSAR